MPEQILLQGKILGTEEFLLAGSAEGRSARFVGEDLLAGRSQWITLLCEVLPRALLAELGLARILLGSSGGGQFLVVLPGAAREAAENFLRAAARQMGELSLGHVTLVWGVTDNLGDWAVIRKRLNDELDRKRNTPLAGMGTPAFQPYERAAHTEAEGYFARELGAKVREASHIGWSPENPGKVMAGEYQLQPFSRRYHAGSPYRAFGRQQDGCAGAIAGAAGARPLHLGRAARRRGQLRPAPAPRAQH
jgi:CRISPR-associated protein Csm1